MGTEYRQVGGPDAEARGNCNLMDAQTQTAELIAPLRDTAIRMPHGQGVE